VDDGDVLSGGNFHGQPLSLPLDTLTIAVQELAAFSERRIFRLMDGRSGDPHALPPFLIASGLNTVVGLNVVGLKRAGFSSLQRSEIKEAFSWVYRRGYNLAQAMDFARARNWSVDAEQFWDFIQHAGKRGICGWRGRRTGTPEREED
jgi:hypothetical protein